MPINTKEIVNEITKITPYILYGGLGGAIMYLNQIRKGETFIWTMFILNIVLAGRIGSIAGNLVPESLGNFQYSIISVCGFISHPLLEFIEKKGLNLVIKILGKGK